MDLKTKLLLLNLDKTKALQKVPVTSPFPQSNLKWVFGLVSFISSWIILRAIL